MAETKDQDWGEQALVLIVNLLQMENEVSYVIECLSEDFRGEAVRGMQDAYDCLQKHPLPQSCAEQVKQMLDEVMAPLKSRDLVLCSRKLYGLRGRLANQAAYLLRSKSPYERELYPLFGREDSDAT